MHYLLDTQILIWAIREETRLSSTARRILEDDNNHFYISMISLWEATIKTSLGKLQLADSFIDTLMASGATILPLKPEHLKILRTLPHHNRDPFDRLLVAQALQEKLTLITSDAALRPYDAKIILA